MTKLQAFEEAARRFGYSDEEIAKRNEAAFKILPANWMADTITPGKEEETIAGFLKLHTHGSKLTKAESEALIKKLLPLVEKQFARN